MKIKLLSIMSNMCLIVATISLSQCSFINNHQPTLTGDLKKEIRSEYEKKRLSFCRFNKQV